MIPDWMKEQNNYSPKKDKDGFFTKTLLSFFKLFRHFHVEKNENLSALRSALRLVLVLGLIILSALSQNILFYGAVIAGYLICLCFSKIAVLKQSFSTALVAALFTAVVMLPSFLIYKSQAILTITIKVFLSVGLLSLYSLLTPWNKITAALKVLKIPGFIVFLIDLTINYILILGNVAYEMLFALKLRSVGKNQNKQKSFSGITGTVFLKSFAASEETQQAMECRLFDGTYASAKVKISVKDFLPLSVLILYIVFYVYTL